MQDLLDILLGPFGTLVLALLILYSIQKKWLVPGWLYREKATSEAKWMEIALRGTSAAETNARTAEKAVTALQENGSKS